MPIGELQFLSRRRPGQVSSGGLQALKAATPPCRRAVRAWSTQRTASANTRQTALDEKKAGAAWENVKPEHPSQVFGQPDARRAWCGAQAGVLLCGKSRELTRR